MKRSATGLASMGLVAVATAVSAPAQTDPTRPANLLLPAAGGADGGAGEIAMRLNAIVLGRDRHYAIIDGRRVNVGERHGDATLVRLTDGEATLKRRNESLVLTLGPQLKRGPGDTRVASPVTRP